MLFRSNAISKWFSNEEEVKRLVLAAPEEMLIIQRYYKILRIRYPKIQWSDIDRVLNYDIFTCKNHNSGLSLKLAEIKNVRSCPYCNRSFTMLVYHKNSYVMRADFDHFLAKSKYPLFALSLYNLIPSCLNCNRTIKRSKEFESNTHLHPYMDHKERDKWKFKYRLMDIDRYLLEINTSKCADTKIDRTITDLKLEEIYQKAHSDYELKDLIALNYSYGKNYINDIVNNVMENSGLSTKDVYLYLFGVEIDANNDLNRLLNKMKRDILAELDCKKE